MDRFLRNNTVLRLLALVIACILWFAVATGGGSANVSGGVTERFPFPVHVLTDAGEVVSAQDITTADVVVTGDPVSLTSLPAQMRNVQLVADARGLAPGRHQVRISAQGMPAVSYSVQPSAITVVIEAKATVTKRVDVTLVGQPAAGYRAGAPTVQPAQVQVSGAKAAVDDVDRVVATVHLDGATQTLTQVVPVTAVDQNGDPVPGATVTPAQVTLIIPVQPPQVTLPVVPSVTGEPAAGYAVAGLQVSPAVVTAYGVPTGGSWASVMAPVDVSGWSASRTVSVPVRLLPGMAGTDPARVSVTVRLEPSLARQFSGIPVTIVGKPAQGTARLNGQPTVDVVVSGPATIVQKMTAADVRAVIDGSTLKSGDTSAPVSVLVPQWVTVISISADHVAVTVQ